MASKQVLWSWRSASLSRCLEGCRTSWAAACRTGSGCSCGAASAGAAATCCGSCCVPGRRSPGSCPSLRLRRRTRRRHNLRRRRRRQTLHGALQPGCSDVDTRQQAATSDRGDRYAANLL